MWTALEAEGIDGLDALLEGCPVSFVELSVSPADDVGGSDLVRLDEVLEVEDSAASLLDSFPGR